MCKAGPRHPRKRERGMDRRCSPGHSVASLTRSVYLFLGEPFWARQLSLRLCMTIDFMGLLGGFSEIMCVRT